MSNQRVFDKINQSAVQLLLPLSIQDTYKIITQEVIKILNAKHASIFLKNSGKLQKVYSSSPELAKLRPRLKGNIYRASLRKSPFSVSLKKLIDPQPILTKLEIKSFVFIPLYYQKKTIGVLSVSSVKDDDWQKEDLEACKLIGTMATLAIRKAQLYVKSTDALQVRDKFLSMTAHELKTPLTSINGYIQLLEKRIEESALEKEKGWLRSLRHESQRLTRMVDELLLLNRIQAGKLEYAFESCNFGLIVQKMIDEVEKTYPSYAYSYRNQLTNNNDKFIGDRVRIEQVIFNILENAAKFSTSQSEILIVLRRTKKHLILEISDQGQGMPEEILSCMFNEFQKGNAENVQEGMGVGLHMSKKIIEQHHGEIAICSTPGQGTSVTIYIPALTVT